MKTQKYNKKTVCTKQLPCFKPVALAVAACFSSVVMANPTAPTVVHGTASFNQAGSILNVTNSHNAIINWGSFSIGVNELTRFIQPSALSAVLNRVVGQDPSAILGALQSNGRVFLINPNGIVFGSGAQINVAGLVASTLNLSNDDFLNNRMRFTDGAGAGSVVNQGSITGGSVYLVGNAVTNNGLITSPNGEVVLAAGRSVELVNPGTPNLRVEVVASDNEVRNLGTITAEAGRIGIYAGLIKQGGVINADSAIAEGGRIMLKAGKSSTLDTGSRTTASGTSGGEVKIQSGDTTLVSGAIEAKGTSGAGGTVHTLGNKVGLLEQARIDVSGESGGGTALVGGDYQGTNPEVQNAFRIYVGPEASIKADAIASGDGGKVVVWADDATRFYGNISARGGMVGGDGGLVEVSGKRWLDYNGLTDTRAPKGATGSLLLDPSNITIDNVVVDTGSFDGDPFYLNGTLPAHIQWATIAAQLVTSNAIISTSEGAVGSEAGNITIAANSPDLVSSNTLDLRANNDILVNGGVTNSGAGNVVMYSGYNDNFATPGVFSGVGTITLNAPISTAGGVQLVAGGGVTQSAGGSITAQSLQASAQMGSVNLASATNAVTTVSGSATNEFRFKNSGNLTVGSTGIAVNAFNSINAVVDLEVLSGGLTVSAPVAAYGGNASYGGLPGGSAMVNLTASGAISVGSVIHAQGGAAYAYGGVFGGNPGGRGGDASISLTAGGGISVGGQIRAYGGNGGSGGSGSSGALGFPGGVGGDGGAATVTLTNTGASPVVIQSGSLITATGGNGGRGGDGGFGSDGGPGANGGQGGAATVTVTSSSGITVNSGIIVTGGVGGEGGEGGYGYGGSSGSSYYGGVGGNGGHGGQGGAATITLTNTSGGNALVISNTANIAAYGGVGGNRGLSGYGSSSAGTAANGGQGGAAAIMATSSGGISVGGSISVRAGRGGGDGGSGSSYIGSGGNGGRGGDATLNLNNTGGIGYSLVIDSGASVTAYGGAGWLGGVGGPGISDGNPGYGGGSGGDGGSATLSLSSSGDLRVEGFAYAEGGPGGVGGQGGNGVPSFYFGNGGAGGGAAGQGGNGGAATVTVSSTNGITVAGTIRAQAGAGQTGGNGGNGGAGGGSSSVGGFGGNGGAGGGGGTGGDATVTLLTNNAGLTVLGTVYAQAGNGGLGGNGGNGGMGGSGYSFGGNGGSGGNGGHAGGGGGATVYLGASTGLNVGGYLYATGGAGYNSGGFGGSGGSGGFGAYGGGISGTPGSAGISSFGGPADLYLVSNAAGDIVVGDTAFIQAYGGTGYFRGNANVNMVAYGGNIEQNGLIQVDGGEVATLTLRAPVGAITQTSSNGILNAIGSFGFPEITLEAASGIGTVVQPIRIANGYEPYVYAQNTGTSGDIALSFYGGAVNIDGLAGVFNNNLTGTYFVQAENGGIVLSAPFVPVVPLSADQSVVLKALNGDVTVDGSLGGSIIIPGSGFGNVTLEALGGGSINMTPGSVIAGYSPRLIADNMHIEGQVLASNGFVNVLTATLGRNIELGTTGPGVGVLALDNTELNNMSAWDGITVPPPGTGGGGLLIGDSINGGAITFTGDVNATAYLNLYGASVGQTGGVITGSVSATVYSGNVTLMNTGNQISGVGGSTAGGQFSVRSANDLVIGDLTTNGGAVDIQTSGSNLRFWEFSGPINAGASSVLLASGSTITDGRAGVDIIAGSATLTAPGGIGTFADPIETQIASLAVSAIGGGEVGVINTGNLLLSNLAFSGTTAAVEASGTLTTGNSIGATGNVALKGQAGLNIAHGINTGSTSNVTLEAGAGTDVVFSGAGGVNTSGGSISVTAGRDIIYGGSSQVNSSSGNILFDAGNDVLFNTQRINTSSGTVQISADRDYVHTSTSSHNTSSGSLTVATGRDFTYSSTSKLNTLSGDVTIQSVGNTTFTAGGVNSSSGIILVQAGGSASLSGGTQLVSGNSVRLEALGAAGAGVTLTGALTKVQGSDVSITGTAGSAASSDNVGVRISGATVRSTSGGVDIIGNGGNGVSNNNGIRIDGGALISSAADILLWGTGAGGTSDNSGVKINNATVQSLGVGSSIYILGEGGLGSADNNEGVRLESGSMITAVGSIQIDGYGGSGGNDTTGVKMASGSTAQSTGGGVIELYGEGGPGVDNNHGVRLEGTALVTSAGNIFVDGLGAGSGNDNTGVKLAGGSIQATGTSNIYLYGEGSVASVNNNEGIRIESGGSITAASGAIALEGYGGGTGSGNHGIRIAGTVSNAGPGAFILSGAGVPGTSAVLLQGSGSLSSPSSMTFTSGFDWSGGTIGGAGTLSTPVGAVTNVTGPVALVPGQTWNNGGTLNISGTGSVDLGDVTPAILNNQAGGVVNISSGAGWSFISNPSTQSGQVNNAGSINVNQNTSWEAAFNQTASGSLNIAVGKYLSMQNGQGITGAASISAGGTLWVSERHGVDTVFSNMTISGTGTLQVLGSSPVAKLTNVSAPGITLKLGSGGQIGVENGTAIFGGLTLDSPAFGSAFSMIDATFAQATGNLTVPGGAAYAGDNTYVAQAGDLLVPGVVSGGAGNLTLAAAAGNLKVIGGTVSADTINLLGTDIIVGDSAASTPSSVVAGSSLVTAALANLKILGGSSFGANARITSNGMLTVSTGGDLVLTGGAGANAWAKLSGNPDVLLAGIGGVVKLDAGSGAGSAAVIEAVSPLTIYLDLLNASSGGYFINGIEGLVYDPVTGTGFIASGSPAVLGSNLMVTYNGMTLPPIGDLLGAIEEALQVPTQTLIVATTESTTPPDAEKEKDIFEDEAKKDKKKDAPVCR